MSFAGSSTTGETLDGSSDNWVSGGLALTSPTSVNGLDLGYEYFAYLDGAGDVGLAVYVINACEFPGVPGECSGGPSYYSIVYDDSAVISGASVSDDIKLYVYWNTTLSAFIFDYQDTGCCGSSYWTAFDLYSTTLPSYAHHYFYLGVDSVYLCGCNPPYDDSYGYQLGYASDVAPVVSDIVIALNSPGYTGNKSGVLTDYTLQHAGTLTNDAGYEDDCDTWWHDNWCWGGDGSSGSSAWAGFLNEIQLSPIDDLISSQVNGQTFTASDNTRTVCVEVTNFASLQSDAEGASEGSQDLGPWIAGHSFYDGTWWNMESTGSCASLTWAYADLNLAPENSILW